MPQATTIQLDEQSLERLTCLAESRTAAARLVERAKIIVGLVAGITKKVIAEQLGIARQTVQRWEEKFRDRGIEGLEDAPRSGRPATIGPEKIAQIIYKTVHEIPCDSTHWSTRSLAQEVEVSPCSISRIWHELKLQPHRVKTFKLSNDRFFGEKTTDVVTLYLNPPPNSVVWSADEQCQIQALTRTQSSLPCAPGYFATKTHDYKRHGTTTLFAALNVGTGNVVFTFNLQHRHQEWIQFLALIEEHSPPDKQIHLIIDNYSAHKHSNVQKWLAEHPRFHIHYTPTSGSWLNQVERVFSEVSQKCLKFRCAETVAALEQAIAQFLNRRNEHPKPFNWKATATEILQKVKRAWQTLHDRYGVKKPSAALASIERHLDRGIGRQPSQACLKSLPNWLHHPRQSSTLTPQVRHLPNRLSRTLWRRSKRGHLPQPTYALRVTRILAGTSLCEVSAHSHSSQLTSPSSESPTLSAGSMLLNSCSCVIMLQDF
jgi:putative transposase